MLEHCQRAMERSMTGIKKEDKIRNTVIRSKTKVTDVHRIDSLKWRWRWRNTWKDPREGGEQRKTKQERRPLPRGTLNSEIFYNKRDNHNTKKEESSSG
ncbi:hypothetical protein EVAR_6909_1 [Eumeta japonica]|uniref:Uncharacterized protein n=1 Tax=Eumeta variegata TaxID=151549 RepID=A0A4C1TGD9_EUMVA|nr:hypothetical protein EVAR_6909_1 [Eumeta japonica]